jgi:hypothetical protein
MAVRLSALTTDHVLLILNFISLLLVLISVKRLSKPQDLEGPEGLDKLKKIHSPHWVSKPRPSGLQQSALTTTLPSGPILQNISC